MEDAEAADAPAAADAVVEEVQGEAVVVTPAPAAEPPVEEPPEDPSAAPPLAEGCSAPAEAPAEEAPEMDFEDQVLAGSVIDTIADGPQPEPIQPEDFVDKLKEAAADDAQPPAEPTDVTTPSRHGSVMPRSPSRHQSVGGFEHHTARLQMATKMQTFFRGFRVRRTMTMAHAGVAAALGMERAQTPATPGQPHRTGALISRDDRRRYHDELNGTKRRLEREIEELELGHYYEKSSKQREIRLRSKALKNKIKMLEDEMSQLGRLGKQPSREYQTHLFDKAWGIEEHVRKQTEKGRHNATDHSAFWLGMQTGAHGAKMDRRASNRNLLADAAPPPPPVRQPVARVHLHVIDSSLNVPFRMPLSSRPSSRAASRPGTANAPSAAPSADDPPSLRRASPTSFETPVFETKSRASDDMVHASVSVVLQEVRADGSGDGCGGELSRSETSKQMSAAELERAKKRTYIRAVHSDNEALRMQLASALMLSAGLIDLSTISHKTVRRTPHARTPHARTPHARTTHAERRHSHPIPSDPISSHLVPSRPHLVRSRPHLIRSHPHLTRSRPISSPHLRCARRRPSSRRSRCCAPWPTAPRAPSTRAHRERRRSRTTWACSTM
jgi:hypothetical protein